MDLISSHKRFQDTGEIYIGHFLFKIQICCIQKNNRNLKKSIKVVLFEWRAVDRQQDKSSGQSHFGAIVKVLICSGAEHDITVVAVVGSMLAC